jgi:hypothetical protein
MGHFSKKCAFTSPANGAGFDIGGGPTRPFIQPLEADWSRRAEVRSLLVCAFLSLPPAYEFEKGVQVTPAPSHKGTSWAPSPTVTPENLSPLSREGRE